MGTHEAILTGIDTRLKTIAGLRTGDVSLAQVVPPCAFATVPTVANYRATMQRGRYQLSVLVYVLVSQGMPSAQAQRLLARYSDPTTGNASSIPLAIEGDRTLGGAVEDCTVEAFRPLGVEEVGAIGYFGGVFQLMIVNRGS